MNLLLKSYLFIFFLSISLAVSGQKSPFQCIIIGEVLDRPDSKELLLTKENADPRVNAVSIPVIDGRFQYSFNAEQVESYALIFNDELEKGAFRPILFFAESDTLYFSLYPQNQYDRNNIQGGVLNRALKAYTQKQDELFGLTELGRKKEALMKENRYLTEEAQSLLTAMEQAENRSIRDSLSQIGRKMSLEKRDLTPEALALEELFRQRFVEWVAWKTEQVLSNPSLITYRELLTLIRMSEAPYPDPLPIAVLDLLASYEKDYRPAFEGHPYTEQMENYLQARDMIKIGGKYIDFVAPDFAGDTIRLSEHIRGKFALINLWASWCGPCRTKGIGMIPLYEEFKDRGFEVLGIARERNKEAGINASEMDRYPWLNLLEINDNQKIWEKYKLGNSGGGMFLVDREGTILAVSPTPEEVRAILTAQLPGSH